MPLSDRDYMRRPPPRQSTFDVDPVWLIIGINTVVFLVAFALSFTVRLGNPAVSFLGLRAATLADRPWTFVTNMFTHVEPMHLIFNMLTLYFFSKFLIALIGQKRFFIIYFGGGLMGNVLFVAAAYAGITSPFVIAIGASGAIFALGGALAVLRPGEKVYVFPIPAPIPLWVAVIGGFLLLFLFPGIAWEAHLGGLLFGLAGGYWIKKRGGYYY